MFLAFRSVGSQARSPVGSTWIENVAYFNGKAWVNLVINDGTKNCTESGFIDFVGPDDHEKCLKFTEDRFWFRARLEMGGYIKPPRIRRVLQNSVESANVRTVYNEILGASDATPLQSYTLLHGPILDGQIIEVRERDEPNPEDIKDLGQDSKRAWGEVKEGMDSALGSLKESFKKARDELK